MDATGDVIRHLGQFGIRHCVVQRVFHVVGLRAVTIARRTRDLGRAVHVPVHLGRVLLGDVHADLRVGLVTWRGCCEAGGQQRVFRRLIEAVHGEVPVLCKRGHRLPDLGELLKIDIREHRADRLGCNLGEIPVLHTHRILLVHGVEQEFRRIGAVKHSAIRQGDLPVDRDHLLQEHRIDHNHAVKTLARPPRGALPDRAHTFRRTLRVCVHREIAHVEGHLQRPPLVENPLFVRGRIADTIRNVLVVRTEIPDGNLAIVRGHNAHRTQQAAAGARFGRGHRHDCIRFHAAGAKDTGDDIQRAGQIVDGRSRRVQLLLTAGIRGGNLADLGLWQGVIFLDQLLERLVRSLHGCGRLSDRLEVQRPVARGQRCVDQRAQCGAQLRNRLGGQRMDDACHAADSCDVIAVHRHVGCQRPQLAVRDLFGGGGFRLQLRQHRVDGIHRIFANAGRT